MNLDTDQYVTQSSIAKMKGMALSLLSYHLSKPDAPKPHQIMGKRVYLLVEIQNWVPKRDNRGRKPK